MRIFSDITFETRYDKEDFTFYHFHASKITSMIFISYLFDFVSILLGISGGAVASSYVSILALGEPSSPEMLIMFYGFSRVVFFVLMSVWLLYYVFRIRYMRNLKSESTSYVNNTQNDNENKTNPLYSTLEAKYESGGPTI